MWALLVDVVDCLPIKVRARLWRDDDGLGTDRPRGHSVSIISPRSIRLTTAISRAM